MSPSSRRLVRISGIFIAVLLIALAFYPGTLATPYVTAQDSPRYAHTILPESSPIYEEYTDKYDPEVYRYDELSPVAQELFDRTRAAEPRPQYNGNRRYVPDVCGEFMLVCDGYAQDELPEEFTYGTELPPEETLAFVEDGDDRYLLQTGYTDHVTLFAIPFRLFIAWLTMFPLAAFVIVVAFTAESDRVLAGTIGAGALVAILSFLTPYLQMNGLGSAWTIRYLLLGSVWSTLLVAGGYKLSQLVFDGATQSS